MKDTQHPNIRQTDNSQYNCENASPTQNVFLMQQLRMHQERLEGLLSSLPGVVWEAWGQPDAASQRIDFVSDYVEAMLGYTVAEWLSTPNFWLTIVHPDDRERAARNAAAGFERGDHTDVFRWVARDGQAIWVEARAVVIHDENGNRAGMRGVTLDISGRIKAENDLHFSEERFRKLFEQSPLSKQIFTPDGNLVQTNKAWEELWGVTLEKIGNYNILQDPQLVNIGVMPLIQRAFAGEAIALPDTYYDPDQTVVVPGTRPRWTRSVVYPITRPLQDAEEAGGESTPDGEAVREVVLVHQDITDWKRADNNLRFLLEASASLSESLDYETTLHNLARMPIGRFADHCIVHTFGVDGIHRVATSHRDPSKSVLFQEIEQRFPADPERKIGVARVWRTGQAEMVTEIPEVLLEEHSQNPEHLALLKRINIQSYVSVPLRSRARLLGAITWLRDGNSPSFDDDDFNLAKDLAQRASTALENTLLYREVHHALAQAEAANQAKDEFLAVVSHELRTPLNAILGWSSLLREESEAGASAASVSAGSVESADPAIVARGLDVIERNCQLQNKLINDVLDISRVMSGKINLDIVPLNLAPLAQNAIEAMQPLAAERDITIEMHTHEGNSFLVDGDDTRLQQVISNLLSNAVKFSTDGGRVEVGISGSEEFVALQIRDYGSGIRPDFLPHVFDRFRQADSSTTRRHGGLGLGLAISKTLIEQHNGTISAASSGLGQGATFTVRLPAVASKSTLADSGISDSDLSTVSSNAASFAEAGHAIQPSEETSSPQLRLSGMHVLLVDDEADARSFVQLALENAGAQVMACGEATQALAAVRESTFDVLVTDIAMPEVDGYELIQSVRALATHEQAAIPAIALTAYSGQSDRERTLAAGFQIHLPKPVTPAQIVEAVAALKPQS